MVARDTKATRVMVTCLHQSVDVIVPELDDP